MLRHGISIPSLKDFENIVVERSSLDNATIIVQRVGYEAFKTDNISVDGPIGIIEQEEGPLLV